MQRVVDFQAGEKLVQVIPLADITTSHNPRNPAAKLVEALPKEGHEGKSLIDLARLGLSENEAERKEFCRLIETYENDPDGVLFLATSRRTGEVQPVLLRDFRAQKPGTDEYVTRYGIIAGERRFLASVYNHAKHGDNPVVGAIVKKMTVQDAEELAFMENMMRRDPHPLEVGEWLHDRLSKTNKATGKPYKLAELAKKFGLDYQYALGRESLAHLTDEDKKRLLSGRLGLTNAVKKGMAIKRGEDPETIDPPDKKIKRQRVLKLTEVRKLFDGSLNGHAPSKDPKVLEGYRMALAEVMGLNLDHAVLEARKRLDAQELAEAEEAERALHR